MGDEKPARVENHACAACGQLDDHPMIHIAGPWQKDESTIVLNPSVHFDCLPDEFLALLHDADGNPLPQHENTLETREAALRGVHGDELVAHIEKLAKANNDNEYEPPDHPVVPGMAVVPETNVPAEV